MRYTIYFFDEDHPMSIWRPCTFRSDGIIFSSTGQYMTYWKAILMNDYISAVKVLKVCDRLDVEILNEEIKDFEQTLWNKYRVDIVYKACFAKVTQTHKLFHDPVWTSKSLLAYSSQYDKVWGIGYLLDDEDAQIPHLWCGYNFLGSCLMRVRNSMKRIWYRNTVKRIACRNMMRY